MAFGIYIHIPYCRQLCSYCDFTKYEWGKTISPERYVELLRQEIATRSPEITAAGHVEQDVTTIYFGGGTPSLFEPPLILAILDELAKAGFRWARGPESELAPEHTSEHTSELTIEIDPATIDEAKLNAYLEMGLNRFSVGAQSFNDRLLSMSGRKHSSQDTIDLLTLLKRYDVNYSFDLLFALPTQTKAELDRDVQLALDFSPSHLSAYCLNVPEGHKLSFNRPLEDEQVEMFDLIESRLGSAGIKKYEISNFAKPGAESKHNMLYWQDQPYWGLGLSSHSYLPAAGEFGTRFWNHRAMKKYADQIDGVEPVEDAQKEVLLKYQSLTDFLHTGLRPINGLDENALRLKFGLPTELSQRLKELCSRGLLEKTAGGWALTRKGRLLANIVFEKLTFLASDSLGPE
jgi:oxygen-independent coproporphyrinogen-3 oxidase